MNTKLHNKDEYVKFISEIINISIDNDKQAIEILLIKNLDKINKYFLDIFIEWIRNTLFKRLKNEALIDVASITIFSEIIGHFPQGNLEINQEIAINSCELLLEFLDHITFLENRNFQELKEFLKIPIQAILADTYLERINGNHTENIEKVIDLGEKSFEGYSCEDTPEQWASTNLTLGIAYGQRNLGNNSENIEKAIFHNNNALKIYTYNDFPQQWAKVQNNLALAYYERKEGNNNKNFERAVEYCQKALLIHTRENYLRSWAKTTINLANIYRDHKERDKLVNLDQAINYYEKVLNFVDPNEMPEEWAKAQVNLGSAYIKKIKTHNDNELNRQKAVDLHITAVSLFTPETVDEISKIPKNLLEAVTNAIIIDDQWTDSVNLDDNTKIENLEKAIKCYEKAITVSTHDIFPEEWAKIYVSLGKAYKDSERTTDAIQCLCLALKFYNPIAFIQESLKIGRLLGNLASYHCIWIEAIQGYTYAVQALEQLRITVNSDLYRNKILEIFSDIHKSIIQSCINVGQIDKAFEYSERSRSQRLVELMASSHLSQGENTPPKVQELLQKYEELQQQIDIERQNYKSENNRSETRAIWQVYNEKIASLETAKQDIWEQLRKEDPILAGEIQVKPLSLSEIQQLIDHPKTAIISFYTTNSDTHIFIITQNSIYLHTCIGEGLETLQKWIAQNWLSNYINHPEKWESEMERFLYELAERLQLSKIINQYLQDTEELIIEPHFLLHQIPFAALPTGEYQEHLVDRFLIRYTPSCQILDFCHQNHNKKRLNLDYQDFQYGTVEDATDDLHCARWEGEQIAKMYNIPSGKRLIGISQATVKNYRKLAEQVQILHSCHHAESCLYNPLESQLKLGDGSITLGQLMSPGWRLPNLVDVFLSCCETNLDNPDITDNLLTLSTGFLCAGAISVISSLWKVDDLATALFSIFYYQQRQEGKNRPEALKAAQIKLRELRKADLEEISQKAENERKQARNQKKQYLQDSKEYLECDRQYQHYAKISIAINKIQKSKGEFPFAHPRYWSAFIAQGLQ